jgi:hypothetical protein
MSGVYMIGFIVFFTSYFTTFDEGQVALSQIKNPVTYDYIRPWIKSMIVGLVAVGALIDDRVGRRRRKIEEEETHGITQEEWIRRELEKGKKV